MVDTQAFSPKRWWVWNCCKIQPWGICFFLLDKTRRTMQGVKRQAWTKLIKVYLTFPCGINHLCMHRARQGLPIENQILALAIGFGVLFKFFFHISPYFWYRWSFANSNHDVNQRLWNINYVMEGALIKPITMWWNNNLPY